MTPDSRLLYLPQASRYAVSAALSLASIPPGRFHVVSAIAKRTGLSASYLAKILQRLALKGVLESRRGAHGGYSLRRPAAKITLAELVAATRDIEGGPMPCMIEARPCDSAKPCSMHRCVSDAEERLWRRLNTTTLADLHKEKT